jgi:SdrD B-like protein
VDVNLLTKERDMLFQNRRTQDRAARHVAPTIIGALAFAAALAFAHPAAAQSCGVGEGASLVCGTVWSDLDGDGIQDAGEPGIGGVEVKVYDSTNTEVTSFFTNADGTFYFDASTFTSGATYTLSIDTPSGTTASPTDNPATTDDLDSDGTDSGMNTSYFTFTSDGFTQQNVDFGFTASGAKNPGTGTPGYWKNHPSAWPSPYTNGITIGGVAYTKSQAIAILSKPGKDKRATMFSSLVSAILNVALGNDSSCVASTITAADAWMATWGVPNTDPIVTGDSAAWAVGEPLHKLMDAYNNGLLCAPHRN